MGTEAAGTVVRRVNRGAGTVDLTLPDKFGSRQPGGGERGLKVRTAREGNLIVALCRLDENETVH